MRYYAPLLDKVVELPSKNVWLIPLYEESSIAENTSLIPGTQIQFVWDSVSLGALKKCPRYYKWTILDGYQLSPQPSTLAFGIYFHKIMEVWHKLLSRNVSKNKALLRCIRLAGLFGEHLTGERPERTKETLVRAVIWYLDQFKDDLAKTTIRENDEPAVEYSFMLPLRKVNSVQQYLAGHLDRVVRFMDQIFVTDYKTTKSQLNDRFFNSFKPGTQFPGYVAAAHILAGTVSAVPEKPAGMIVDGIQLGVTYNRFARSIITYSTLEINDYLNDLEHWLQIAAMLADKNHWPANEASCTNYGGCVFQSICASTPPKRQRMIEANFTKTTWDPRKSR